jgi:dTDP-4-dehydrorhamnose 3,5-epimerase
MNIQQTDFKDLFLIELTKFKDQRGEFVKTIHKETYELSGLEWIFTESFFSVSKKNVIRGMHFQVPEEEHAKLVYVVKGRIIDVVVDLRKSSSTFGQHFSVELSEENRRAIYIGKGFAHGFVALEDDCIVEYHTTTSQNRSCEGGILYNSFGYTWPVPHPVLSERDQHFPALAEFKSPF